MSQEIIDFGKEVFAIESDELRNIGANLGEKFAQSVLALKKVVESDAKLIVLGVGKSGNLAQKIAATFTSTGLPAVVLDATNALHGDLGIISKNDAVLLLSYSGETDELLKTLPYVRRLSKTLIALSGNENSSLVKSCDLALIVKVKKEACPLNLAPTSSTTAMLVMGDALAMALLNHRGFKEKDFARYHPSGQLGRRLLTKVSDVMRKRKSVAICDVEDRVGDVLRVMTEKRGGACIITDSTGKLLGIFTQGDFVRNYQSDFSIAEKSVKDYMTKDPITINGNELASKLLQILESHKIDDIIVVNDSSEPIGLVDTQDLSRLKIF